MIVICIIASPFNLYVESGCDKDRLAELGNSRNMEHGKRLLSLFPAEALSFVIPTGIV